MGKRNADRIPLIERKHLGETVADMHRERWDVLSRCRTCGLMMSVDLTLIIRVSGPKTTLWNRVSHCRRIGCNGQVEFQAKAPGMAFFQELRSYDTPIREPAWMRAHGGRKSD